MAGILWSQQEKLAGAVEALKTWKAAAAERGVRVDQLTITLLDAEDSSLASTVIFDWDEAAQDYRMRTTGD